MDADDSANPPLRLLALAAIPAKRALVATFVLTALIDNGSGLALAAQQSPSTVSPDAAATEFGDAIPNDRFVHEFQRQVIQQLQSTLNQASREQDERLRRFEEQQSQRLREQSEALQRSVDDLQSRLSERSSTDVSDVPRVNVRQFRDESAQSGTAPPADSRATEPPLAPPLYIGPPSAPRAARLKGISANLSPHGFVEGRLLNGVVAVVGGAERESVVALTGAYQAANGFATDLDGCFALVQGRPELPAGRIDFKVSRLTCNFPDGASKTWDVSGWLVDTDGIRGLRARIVQNVGRKAIVAAAGGGLSGFGRRLSQQQYQINAGPLASSSTFIGNATHDAIGGSADAAASALEQSVADYYNLYAPSLQVGGGTPASLVIANELKFPPSGRLSTQTHTTTP
jgi:conjugal transfer pilus assembly protein TraB